MTRSPIVKTVTVGASLTATLTFPADMLCENVGILAPVATPNYTFSVKSPAGIVVVGSDVAVTIQNARLLARYQLKGGVADPVILTIDAADQGAYKFEFYPRES